MRYNIEAAKQLGNEVAKKKHTNHIIAQSIVNEQQK